MFGARFATLYPYFIDHVTSDFGEFQVWEGSSSSWAINHARTYGGPGIDPRGTNGVSLRGVPVSVTKPVSEYHGNIVEKDDIAANGFLYFAGTQGGALSADLAYNAPPSFFQEHSRSLVWLPGVKSLVVFDRTNVKSADEGACTKYSGLFGAWINSRPRKELYIWSPENPTLTAGYTEWAYSGTKKTRVNHLTPTSFTRVVDDLNLVWVTGYYQLGSGTGVAANRKFNTRILPTVDQRWDTFLNVWNYYGDGTPVTTTLVQDAAAQVDASLVVGTGANYLLAFNAIQGPDIPDPTGSSCATNGTTYFSGLADDILGVVRLRDAGYTLSFTGPAGGTKALLFDLDPNTEWDYKINGGAAADLTVDVNGIAVVDIAATGAVTLEVISAGTLPVSVQTGSLADGKVGEAYSQTLAAIGGIGAPYTWSKTVGSFPGGLSMTAGGVISGTATTPETQTFTVQACDGDTTCGTRSLSIFVKDVPALSGGYVNGTVGVAYSDGITLTGGSAPVVYTLDSGSLCAGLSLASATGLITGTPTTTQTCQFTIKVTDNAAETDTLDASITIASARAVLTITSDPGPTSAVIHYGTVNAEDDCVVTLYDGNSDTVLDTVTSTGPGDSTRVASFSGLTPLTAYSTGIICDTADADRYTFSTLEALPVGGTVNWTYTVKPQAQLVARSVAKVSVEYNLVGETADTETASCATGCTLTLPLLSGQIYEIRHIWKTAADAVVATSRKGLVAVP